MLRQSALIVIGAHARRMEASSDQPFVNESDATSWVRTLLERFGVPAIAAADMTTAAALSDFLCIVGIRYCGKSERHFSK